MIDLARQVHEQADEAEDPDVAGKGWARTHFSLIATIQRERKAARRFALVDNIALRQTFATLQS